MRIEEITFDQAKRLWSLLWPNSKLKPQSSLTYPTGYDMSIYEKYEPVFFGALSDDILVGINSGFKSNDTHYRSRGLYTLPEYRGQGVAYNLLLKTIRRAKEENCELIWTIPRKESFHVYERAGFEQVSEWSSEGMDFGINCYAVIDFHNAKSS